MKIGNALRVFSLGALFMALFIAPTLVRAEEGEFAEQKKFIEGLGNDVIQILINRDEPMAARKEKFRAEINQHFDLKAIGKFILSRHWRRMSEAQQTTYLELFEEAIIENYAAQFNDYNNQKLVILSARSTTDGGTVVKSDIKRPGKGEPLHIDWKIFNTSKGLKVLDVIVNNVSMSITLRNEYSSAIQNRGGYDGLLDYLREKIQADQAKQG